MSRYRKVEIRVWNDDRFRDLSHKGQFLWLYMLCGPRTTTFPGLVVAREAVMADDLGWTLQAFREAFAEASTKGMARADWKAGIVLLPKALIDSMGDPRDSAKPESPNVIRSWAKSWTEVPDSTLKTEYLRLLGTFTEALGAGYAQAFREGFAKALAKASVDPSPNQDQEQEQEKNQEQEEPPIPPEGGGRFGLGSGSAQTGAQPEAQAVGADRGRTGIRDTRARQARGAERRALPWQ